MGEGLKRKRSKKIKKVDVTFQFSTFSVSGGCGDHVGGDPAGRLELTVTPPVRRQEVFQVLLEASLMENGGLKPGGPVPIRTLFDAVHGAVSAMISAALGPLSYIG